LSYFSRAILFQAKKHLIGLIKTDVENEEIPKN